MTWTVDQNYLEWPEAALASNAREHHSLLAPDASGDWHNSVLSNVAAQLGVSQFSELYPPTKVAIASASVVVNITPTDLVTVLYAIKTDAAAARAIRCQYNSETGTHYSRALGTYTINTNGLDYWTLHQYAGQPAYSFTYGWISFLNCNETSYYPHFLGASYGQYSANHMEWSGGLCATTALLTALTFTLSADNIEAGSEFAVYGSNLS
jgi:hypothetical protein